KATRESKQYTSWLTPNEDYEKSLRQFVETTLADEEFRSLVNDFVVEITAAGRINSLAQTLLKLTVTGVPDIYQGCELWDLNLVDPDNRRPVDYTKRRELLKELDQLSPEEIVQRSDEGLSKLLLVRQTLRVRCDHHEQFEGAYEPLTATGEKAE